MKRLALVFILLLAVVGFLGWAISRSAGYVLITYDQFRYESSFWVFLALLACVWLLAMAVHWLLGLLQASGALVNPWSRRHRERRSEEHTSELQSRENLVCRLLLEKKKSKTANQLKHYTV